MSHGQRYEDHKNQ